MEPLPSTNDLRDRRHRIANAARQVIVRDGIEGATIRDIAAELGCSTRSITHYFTDKEDLLLSIYGDLAREGRAIFAAPAHGPGGLVACLMAMTAIDVVNVGLWRVYVAFWERAARDPRFAEAQRDSIDFAECLIKQVLTSLHPHLPDPIDCARQLLALVNGISVQALLEPDSWTPDEARDCFQQSMQDIVQRSAKADDRPLGNRLRFR
ncbi:MAG: TetR family transcriptional regulator [Novosphingobium sp.]|nr:TetR family transcriptional regulator [Novosphingobium sp.]